MKKFSKFDTATIRKGSLFEPLPKGAYVIKILRAEEEENKSGEGSHIKIAFDIAEGEHKDFYKKQFDAVTDEDKHWPWDAVYNLAAPDDNSPQWQIDNFGTFVAALEDSNPKYHWDWDESKWKGLVLGALFRIEQNENGGNVYSHTRPLWFRDAQAVRDGKCGKLPNDKLVPAPADGFVKLDMPAPDEDTEIPF